MAKKRDRDLTLEEGMEEVPEFKKDTLFYNFKLNEDQENLKDAIMDKDNQVILVNSVAGSGKTLIAVACARILVGSGDYDEAVFVFPTVEENSLGFRPGDTKDKESDYLEPLYDALYKINERPTQAIKGSIADKNGTSWISARSCTFMRGINLEKKVVIVDECQNLSVPLIKRIISRCHDNCKVIVLGCTAQMDVSVSKSGFQQLIEHMRGYEGYVEVKLTKSYRGRLAEHIDKL